MDLRSVMKRAQTPLHISLPMPVEKLHIFRTWSKHAVCYFKIIYNFFERYSFFSVLFFFQSFERYAECLTMPEKPKFDPTLIRMNQIPGSVRWRKIIFLVFMVDSKASGMPFDWKKSLSLWATWISYTQARGKKKSTPKLHYDWELHWSGIWNFERRKYTVTIP